MQLEPELVKPSTPIFQGGERNPVGFFQQSLGTETTETANS